MKKGSFKADFYEEKIINLYKKGLSDYKIAKEINVSSNTIRNFRIRNNLAPNRLTEGEKKNRRFLYNIKQRYGITLEEYINMSNDQDNLCWICKKSAKLYIDHCHKTNNIRGLLCKECNFGIGLFKEDKIILNNAILYLEKNGRNKK